MLKFCDNDIFFSQASQKLQEATWIFLVNYLSTKEEKQELLKSFQALDTNGDGQLSKEELIAGDFFLNKKIFYYFVKFFRIYENHECSKS